MLVHSSANQFVNRNPYIFECAIELLTMIFPEKSVEQLKRNMHVKGGPGFSCEFPDQPGETEFVLYVPSGFLIDLQGKQERLASLLHEFVHLMVAWELPQGAVDLTDDEHEALARSFELHVASTLANLGVKYEAAGNDAGTLPDIIEALLDRGKFYPRRQDDLAYLMLGGMHKYVEGDMFENELEAASAMWLRMAADFAARAMMRTYARGE